jgi:hypothetical protein
MPSNFEADLTARLVTCVPAKSLTAPLAAFLPVFTSILDKMLILFALYLTNCKEVFRSDDASIACLDSLEDGEGVRSLIRARAAACSDPPDKLIVAARDLENPLDHRRILDTRDHP